MTETLYLSDSNVLEFEATVERVVGDRIVLNRTAFYPEGGGQPADHGTLVVDGECWAVEDVQKSDTIYHHLDQEPPTTGTVVAGEVDAERRRAHSRYHTAQHLLSAIVLDEFDAATTGNQLYGDRARLDCDYDRFSEDDLGAIEERMNDIVEAELGVRWYVLDREEAERRLDPERTRLDLLPESIADVRIIEIGDPDDPFDRTACAGTHVENTRDIGPVTVTGRESRGAGEERLRFELDDA